MSTSTPHTYKSISDLSSVAYTVGTRIAKIVVDDEETELYIPNITNPSTSTNITLTFPDWDESKAKFINSGDTIAGNGWIVVKYPSKNDYILRQVFVNNCIASEKSYSYNGYNHPHTDSIIPVSINDTITCEGSDISLTFYPAKSVSQEVPSNCTSYVIESGRFNSTDGTTHSDNSENDSWYRLYSDGWCELGGYILDLSFDLTTCSVSLIKPYNNTNYTILYSIDRTNNGTNMSVCYTTNKMTNSFEILKDNASAGAAKIVGNISWEAKGFIN